MTIPIEPIADTIPVACARLGISRSTCYLEISQGKLRAVKVRGRTLLTREDQTAWLNSLPALRPTHAA
jgi:excisionase family DNA binding protein